MLGRRYAVQMLALMGYRSVYLEAECATIGDSCRIVYDSKTSNNGYVEIVSDGQVSFEAPADDAYTINFSFVVDADTTYYIYGRVHFPYTDSGSLWLKINDGEFIPSEELETDEWDWIKLSSHYLPAGEHTLTIACSIDSAKIDKICIKNSLIKPVDLGEEAEAICYVEKPAEPTEPEPTKIGVDIAEVKNGFSLGQNYPNPFTKITSISFEIPRETFVSMRVLNSLGTEVAELGGRVFTSGKHTVDFNSQNFPQGQYLYRMVADNFTATRKMVIQVE